jgi:rubrerythrin
VSGLPIPREAYEGEGGWKDGRFGQAYDLLAAALKERGEEIFRHPLLMQIESLDGEVCPMCSVTVDTDTGVCPSCKEAVR